MEGKTPAAYKRKADRAQGDWKRKCIYAREAENERLEGALAQSEETREAQDSVLRVMSARATFEMARLEEYGVVNHNLRMQVEAEADRLRAEENKQTLERDRAVRFAKELMEDRDLVSKKAMAAASRAVLAESQAKVALRNKESAEGRLATLRAEHDQEDRE